jgi:hypothetical protein
LPKKTIATAVASGSDVLVQALGNQPALVQHLQALAKSQEAGMRYHHDEIGKRNRIESRTTSVWHVPKAWLSELDWPPEFDTKRPSQKISPMKSTSKFQF